MHVTCCFPHSSRPASRGGPTEHDRHGPMARALPSDHRFDHTRWPCRSGQLLLLKRRTPGPRARERHQVHDSHHFTVPQSDRPWSDGRHRGGRITCAAPDSLSHSLYRHDPRYRSRPAIADRGCGPIWRSYDGFGIFCWDVRTASHGRPGYWGDFPPHCPRRNCPATTRGRAVTTTSQPAGTGPPPPPSVPCRQSDRVATGAAPSAPRFIRGSFPRRVGPVCDVRRTGWWGIVRALIHPPHDDHPTAFDKRDRKRHFSEPNGRTTGRGYHPPR